MNNIALFRTLRGWSQSDLAHAIGVNQSTVQRAEAEHASARLDTYRKCAEALDVTLCDLFCPQRSALEHEVNTILSEIPLHRQRDVLTLLELARSRASEEAAGNAPARDR